jgi:hypothetical protein
MEVKKKMGGRVTNRKAFVFHYHQSRKNRIQLEFDPVEQKDRLTLT